MDLKEFVEAWKFAVYHLCGTSLYLERGDAEFSMIDEYGETLGTWDKVPEVLTAGEFTIWPHYPKVTAWEVRAEHLKILNQYNPCPGRKWIGQGTSTATPVIFRGG